MSRVLVEAVDIRAEQFVDIKARQFFADVGLRFAEHGFNRFVHVNNFAAVVGHHDVGADVIERDLDARCAAGFGGNGFHILLELVA